MCLSEAYADVFFLVENERIPGHKAILASRSDYFRALLFGSLSESSKSEIVLPNIPASSFKVLLAFFYSGEVTFQAYDAIEILEISNQFGAVSIENAISKYFQRNLSPDNIVETFNAACLYSISDLRHCCYTYFCENIADLVETSTHSLSKTALELVLQRSHFVPDNIMYAAIQKWCKLNENCSQIFLTDYFKTKILNPKNKGIFVELDNEFEANHLTLIFQSDEKNEGCSFVVEASRDKDKWTKIVESKKYLCNIQHSYFAKQKLKYLNFIGRKCCLDIKDFKLELEPSIPRLLNGLVYPTHNVATVEMGASTVHAELINGNKTNYGGMHGFAAHDIPNGEFLLLRLGQPFMIDSLRLLLWDHNTRYYHYYIDCSLDNQNWTRIVDRTNQQSRSWQSFCFNPTPMMYIKIAGTYNTENRWFHCVHFECPSQDLTTAVRV